jgi:hypothetical protein
MYGDVGGNAKNTLMLLLLREGLTWFRMNNLGNLTLTYSQKKICPPNREDRGTHISKKPSTYVTGTRPRSFQRKIYDILNAITNYNTENSA